jgi:hypothetical protein
MKRKLKVTVLTLLLIASLIAIPIWIGPDLGPDIHTALGLLLEWMLGVIGIAFIVGCLGVIGKCFHVFYTLVDDFLDR